MNLLLDTHALLWWLDDHHRDRFDRMLIAQAAVERLTVVTHDSRFRDYGVPLLAT